MHSMDLKKVDIREPCRMHADTNYQILQTIHQELINEEGENEFLQEIDYTFVIIVGDKLTDLHIFFTKAQVSLEALVVVWIGVKWIIDVSQHMTTHR